MHALLHGWGKALYKVRWVVVALWIAGLLFGGFAFGKLTPLLSGGGWDVPGSQSLAAGKLLASEFEGRSESSLTLVLKDPKHAAGSPEYNEKLQKIVDRLKTEEGVSGVFSILSASEGIGSGLVGQDPNLSIAFVDMDTKLDFLINEVPDYQERVVEQAASLGAEAYLVGGAAFWGESSVQSQEGLAKAEMIVFPLIVIILLLVFRSIMAMVTPLMVTIASVLVAMGIVYLVALQVELSVFVTNSAMMLGLGVGIDYSLFMVSRFKAELAVPGNTKQDALVKTMGTAGHTVFFSALTVIAALSALFTVPIAAIKAIAFGGIVVVFVAGLASLTLLPAVLVILGTRINKGSIPFLRPRETTRTSGWKRWTNAIMRRPVLFLILTLAALGAFAYPALDMKLNSPDIRTLPADTSVRQGFTLMEESFGIGAANQISVVLHNETSDLSSPEALAKIAALQAELAKQDHVIGVSAVTNFFPGMEPAAVSGILNGGADSLPQDVSYMVNRYVSTDRHTGVLEVELDQYGSSDVGRDFIKHLRDTLLPGFELPAGTVFSIGGETMTGMDTSKAINDSLLPALGVMLVLIFLILVLSFKSLLLPLKAIILNLFSVAATYGILVFVFALGYGSEIFDVESNGYIIHFVPVLLLALLFGLSTDYEVFLVSRIKEEYDRTGAHEDSIAEGMEKTGPLITGAAVLMVAVFAGFAFSGVLPIQMLGFGMAIAIALDSTVIRMLLVPVTMKLLGRASWWFPGRRKLEPSQPRKRSDNSLSRE
ncbi:MMPL family transporter [Cohnella cholangitidis]|uniref:MMPL family transporter n=1 Tax=Cohnella cholangitidis TaxID=2598458 RepID=A0A7G5C0Y3_9BACL|nr:MMPL family transporter [Cohnella cholangitidis]QMV42867.1 MMPL family transporter [Cohnella cholangitidis]